MKIEMRRVADIKPYPHNPRRNDHAVDAVAASLRQFGFRQPLVLDPEGVVVVGSTRYKAALKLGLKEVPVHVAVGLTPEQLKAYRLADNKTAEIADWDYEALVQELADPQEMDFDLSLTGFCVDEVNDLFQTEVGGGLTDPDDIPEPPDKAITQAGELWLLGEHRLLCGDAARSEDIDRLLGGVRVQLVNTDPPYNVRVEPRSNNAIANGVRSFASVTRHQKPRVVRHPKKAKRTTKKLRAKDRPLINDYVSELEFEALLRAWFGNLARVLEPGRAFYVWGGYANCGNYPPVLKASGLYFSQAVIWVKEHPVLTRKDFMGNHEWCFYGWREGAAHRFFGPKNAVDVWPVKKVNPQNMVHLTEKPVELATRAIQYSSPPGECVLDPFGGLPADTCIDEGEDSMLRQRVRRLETLVMQAGATEQPPPRQLKTAQDVIDLLHEQVEMLRGVRWANAVQKARAIGYLAGIARKAIETGTLAERLEILDIVLRQRKENGNR